MTDLDAAAAALLLEGVSLNLIRRGDDGSLVVNSRVMWTARCRVVCTTESRPGVDHEVNPEPVMVS